MPLAPNNHPHYHPPKEEGMSHIPPVTMAANLLIFILRTNQEAGIVTNKILHTKKATAVKKAPACKKRLTLALKVATGGKGKKKGKSESIMYIFLKIHCLV